MKKKIDQAVRDEEAANLISWMEKRGFSSNHASFAAKCGRTRAELSQHIKTERPIPLSAVKSYANILQCEIEDISPRWASELTISSEDKLKPVSVLSKRDANIKTITDLLHTMTDEGLAVVLDKAEEMQRKYPRESSKRA